jgi:hypothetical protein
MNYSILNFRALLLSLIAAAAIGSAARAQDALPPAGGEIIAGLEAADFSRADAIAASYKGRYADAADLARQLTAELDSELDQARVLFMWIALNIRYDCQKLKKPPMPVQLSGASPQEVAEQIKQLREKLAEQALKSKRGVCQDYSELFAFMAQAVGLEAVVIDGNARNKQRPFSSRLGESHAWNAVKIDGQWGLLDATWAAGYVEGDCAKFVQRLAPGFFLPAPAMFAQDHWPNEPSWQLLDEPLGQEAFSAQPLLNYGQTNYRLTYFSPAAEAVPGEEELRQLRFKFVGTPPVLAVQSSTGRPIAAKSSQDEEGYLVLRFPARSLSELIIFGADGPGKPGGWLAKYKLR